MKDATLPENVELLRSRVIVEKDRVFSVSNSKLFRHLSRIQCLM